MVERIKLYRGYGCNNSDSVKNLESKLKSEGDQEITNRRCIIVPIERQKICQSKNPYMTQTEIKRTIHSKSVDEIVSDILKLPPDIRRYNSENDIGLMGKCACADLNGAMYYATRDTGMGIVLEATVPTKRLFVDGVDFLYTFFSDYIVKNFNKIEDRWRDALVGAYGIKILQYIDQAPFLLEKLQKLENYVLISRSEPKIKDDEYISSAMCRYVDYICTDQDIIEAHLFSKTLIKGRYNTVFQSAFGIIDGINASEVNGTLLPNTHLTSEYIYEINIFDVHQKLSLDSLT